MVVRVLLWQVLAVRASEGPPLQRYSQSSNSLKFTTSIMKNMCTTLVRMFHILQCSSDKTHTPCDTSLYLSQETTNLTLTSRSRLENTPNKQYLKNDLSHFQGWYQAKSSNKSKTTVSTEAYDKLLHSDIYAQGKHGNPPKLMEQLLLNDNVKTTNCMMLVLMRIYEKTRIIWTRNLQQMWS